MNHSSKLFVVKSDRFFFGWGFYYYSAGYFCCKPNKDDDVCVANSYQG